MKALVKSQAEPGLWLEEVPEPELGINDVLIKINKTAITRLTTIDGFRYLLIEFILLIRYSYSIL